MAVIQMPGGKGGNETGMITRWHKKTGDWVAEGDELFSFDTDEGTFTVKSQKAGRLVAVFVPEGEIVHCPADVGMLTTPSPDSVLKLGRQQFIDETKPLEAREPAVPAAEEIPVQDEAEKAPAEEAEAVTGEMPGEEHQDAEEAVEIEEAEESEAEFSEEELLEYVEDDLSEIEAMEEPAEEAEEEAETEEAIISEEELLQYVEEDTAELEMMDEVAESEEEIDEVEPINEDEAEEESAAECAEVRPAAARPASVTAQADMTLCMDIAARTGVSLKAMVRFAAMHTALGAYLEPMEACGLRALNEMEVLANVCDLSGSGVTAAMRTAQAGEMMLLVSAVHDAWRVNNDALEVYPCLNLTLAFDENVLALDAAAAGLKETCGKLENLIGLLI